MQYEQKFQNSVQIGRVLKHRRLELGLTLSDCSALCGIGINTLSRIENGNSNSTVGAVLNVAQNLGVDLIAATINPNSDGFKNWV